jgi:hypothetical protein
MRAVFVFKKSGHFLKLRNQFIIDCCSIFSVKPFFVSSEKWRALILWKNKTIIFDSSGGHICKLRNHLHSQRLWYNSTFRFLFHVNHCRIKPDAVRPFFQEISIIFSVLNGCALVPPAYPMVRWVPKLMNRHQICRLL